MSGVRPVEGLAGGKKHIAFMQLITPAGIGRRNNFIC
jgi:hypothetical protein